MRVKSSQYGIDCPASNYKGKIKTLALLVNILPILTCFQAIQIGTAIIIKELEVVTPLLHESCGVKIDN